MGETAPHLTVFSSVLGNLRVWAKGKATMNVSAVAAVAALGVALSGCATVIEGTSQSIAITTPPTTGAYCTLTSNEGNVSVITPGVAHVEKSKEDIVAHCTKDGWQDASATISSDFQGWTAGNLVLGGVVGFGVDALDGAMHKYPHAFEIPMQPIKGASVPPSAPTAVSMADPALTVRPAPNDPAYESFDKWQDQNGKNAKPER